MLSMLNLHLPHEAPMLHAARNEVLLVSNADLRESAALIVLVVRSRHGLFSSRPGRLLLWSTLAVVAATLMLPLTPLFEPLGFTAVPPLYVVLMGVIVGLYLIAAEFAKKMFYRISGE
jgi:Mg2+-importing ATPase